jgi:hypothetical protein
MENKRAWFLLVIILIIGLVVSFLIFIYVNKDFFEEQIRGKTKACEVDSDCAPVSCCHASACIEKEKAPNCTGVVCTQECKPNTLDCGQGSCKCVEGYCGVIIESSED